MEVMSRKKKKTQARGQLGKLGWVQRVGEGSLGWEESKGEGGPCEDQPR